MQATTNSLLIGLRDNRSDAWSRFNAVYCPAIRAWLHRQGIGPDDADDILQETLLVMVRKMSDFRRQRTGSFRCWLRSIMAHCVAESLRRRRRIAPSSGDANWDRLAKLADPTSEAADQWEEEHERHLFRCAATTARSEFSTTTWRAFERTAVQGDSARSAARDLGISTNAVYVARSRVTARLKELVAEVEA